MHILDNGRFILTRIFSSRQINLTGDRVRVFHARKDIVYLLTSRTLIILMDCLFNLIERCDTTDYRTLNYVADTINRIHVERVKHRKFNLTIIHFEWHDLIAVCQFKGHHFECLSRHTNIGQLDSFHVELLSKDLSNLLLSHSLFSNQRFKNRSVFAAFVTGFGHLSTSRLNGTVVKQVFIN